MTRDRIVQLVAVIVMAAGITASGSMLPRILEQSDRSVLRYTDVSVEGAPPWIALGTMFGSLRGLLVDFLWLRIDINKSRGLFFEVMADADIITRLQPRFAGVWAFHGHNMAYNISVATHTQEDRWEWVNAGLRLIRNEGLRHNPNDLLLHRELAFFFAHKIEGVSDDAHLYYKTQFCREWHGVLGEPPADLEERIAWMKAIADAPATLDAAIALEPEVRTIVDQLQQSAPGGGPGPAFELDGSLLRYYAEWIALHGQSAYADILGRETEVLEQPRYVIFDRVASDADLAEAWDVLIRHVRKRVLIDEYNMDPRRMYEYTRDLGPIDWRHGEAHALYWSRRGSELGEGRIKEHDIYHVLNNDRIQLQAMQGLARSGRVQFDWFSEEMPGRMPDPRWIDSIDSYFEQFYAKHFYVRGAGGESFIGFFQNFLSFAIRQWYRAGERDKAEKLLARLDELFGSGARIPNTQYLVPLDVFVRDQTFEQYEVQPHLAPSEVAASLRYGLIEGVGRGRPEVLRQALEFAGQVTEFFRTHENNAYLNKFGRARMAELVYNVGDSAKLALFDVMVDRSIRLEDRMTIWSQLDKDAPGLRPYVYDAVRRQLDAELRSTPYGERFTIDQILPAPPNMEALRIRIREEQQERQKNLDEQRARDAIERG
ncbi:MAG: hypothetical protein ACYTGG_06605 [Planctomycetota bacterium]|jgi:hypothetical protein